MIKNEIQNEIVSKLSKKKRIELPKIEIKFPFVKKICRYYHLKELNQLLVATCAEITLFDLKSLNMLEKVELYDIFSGKPVRIFKPNTSHFLYIIYDCFEILKVKINKLQIKGGRRIELVKHVWCFDMIDSPSEYRFTSMNGLNILPGLAYFESFSKGNPVIVNLENYFDHENNVFKGSLKKIFDFYFMFEDPDSNMFITKGNYLVSFNDQIFTAIDFSPRLRKIRRKVEIYLGDLDATNLNFEEEGKKSNFNIFRRK